MSALRTSVIHVSTLLLPSFENIDGNPPGHHDSVEGRMDLATPSMFVILLRSPTSITSPRR